MKNPTYTDSELRAFFDLCEQMQSEGNGGWYTGDLCQMGGAGAVAFIRERKHKPYREGIIFYSTGWGWRLRKNWRDTFGQRFYETVVNWQDAPLLKGTSAID
jgi:hypothetical protein